MNEGRGITIPSETLEKYMQIKNDPARSLIKAVRDYYDATFKGKTVDVQINGGVLEIVLENDGKKKSVGWRMDERKAATFEQLDKMISGAEYAHSQENIDSKDADVFPQFHYFATNARIDGVDVPVKIYVRDATGSGTTEHRYYTHKIEKGEVYRPASPAISETPVAGQVELSSARSFFPDITTRPDVPSEQIATLSSPSIAIPKNSVNNPPLNPASDPTGHLAFCQLKLLFY